MTPRTPRLAATAAAITAALLGLTGCTLFGQPVDEAPIATLEIDTPDVPETLQQPQPLAQAGGLLSATAEAPYAFGGSLQQPGEPPVPTVWTSADASAWQADPVDEDFEGAFDGTLTGSAELTALVGSRWTEGTRSVAAWTSTDRAEWTAVAFPDDFTARTRLSTAEVLGDELLVIGTDADGAASGVRVSDGESSALELPSPPKGQLLNPAYLGGDGADTVLLLATTGPEGENAPWVVYRSDDAGESWADPVPLAGAVDTVTGVAWTGSGFVATGGQIVGAATRQSAWSSPDGSAWTKEGVPASPGTVSYEYGDADVLLGAPGVAADGTVAVVSANDNSQASAVFTRSPAGAWAYAGETGTNTASGERGDALPVPGGVLGVVGSGGALRAGILAGTWADRQVFAERAPAFGVRSIDADADGLLVQLSRNVFTSTSASTNDWTNRTRTALAAVSADGAVTDAEYDPPELSGFSGVVRGSSDGTDVVLGSISSPSADFPTSGFVRTEGGAWTPVTGLPQTGITDLAGVTKVGDAWYAVGDYGVDSIVGTAKHAVAFSSQDGVTWAGTPGDFGDGSLETNAVDVCAAPDGTPLAVGWAEQTTGDYRLAAWTFAGGSWARVDLGNLADGYGYAETCASGDDGVVVSGWLGGRSSLFSVTDDGWERTFSAGRGDQLSEPTAVPGGFAASGIWNDDTHSQPVVWLSPDGVDWTPVAVPSLDVGVTTGVAVLGDDLLVTMPPSVGSPIVIVRDIEQVIADQTAED